MTLYAGTGTPGRVYRYVSGTTWELISPDMGAVVLCLATHNGVLYAGISTGTYGSGVGYVYKHISGSSWEVVGNIMAEFYMGNYRDYEDQPKTQLSGSSKNVFIWRGYSFEVERTITVKALLGGIRLLETAWVGHVALYEATATEIHNPSTSEYEYSVEPTSLLRYGTMNSVGYKQVLNIEPVTLRPGRLYIIAQGAGQESTDPLQNPLCMGSVEWFDDDLNNEIVANTVLSKLEPWEDIQWFKAWIWNSNVLGFEPSSIVGETPVTRQTAGFADLASARPPIGFLYDAWNIWVKKGGEWIQVTEIWTKKGGVWQAVTDVSTLKGGNWNTV